MKHRSRAARIRSLPLRTGKSGILIRQGIMFKDARLQTIICTTDIERAERFFSDTLDLRLGGRSHGALVYIVGGSDLRVSPVPEMTPSEHTVVGFAVNDIRKTIRELAAKGIDFDRFPQFPQDADGILSIPGGDMVAWFRDPDGNLLSVVQYAASK